jgi:RimJ/RimL family protein N-acetyltransferase
MTPTLHTARLVLRPSTMGDFDGYAAFLASDRARHMDGPHDRPKAWDWFCHDTAGWALMGMGGLVISLQGRALGLVTLNNGPQFPEPELGWCLWDAADERHGYALEAALALRNWGFGPRGLPTMVSYIDPANSASARLAARLGAVIDAGAATPGNGPTDVWRHKGGAA